MFSRFSSGLPALIVDRRLGQAASLLVVISLFSLVFTVVHPDVPGGHDTSAHFTYTYLFHHAISDGQFPVRWVEWIKPGHGQPLFNYYQPGLYYLVELVHLVVPSLSRSLQLTVVLSWWLGAWFMFLRFRRHGTLPGVIAAWSFALAPYIVIDVFVRGAYPELAAVAFAPGVLWAIDRLLIDDRPRRAHQVALAVLLFLLAICHLPTLLIFSPVFAACAIATAWRTPRRLLHALALPCLIGAGLAAFYVIPALTEMNLIRMQKMTAGYFDYHQHFVDPLRWVQYDWGYGGSTDVPGTRMSLQIGPLQWTIILLAAAAAIAWLRAGHRLPEARRLVFWLVVIAGALFMMTHAALPVWDALPPLAFLQFPWRFLMVLAVACGALAALLLAAIDNQRVQAGIVLALVVVQIALAWHQVAPPGYTPRERMNIDRYAWRYTNASRDMAFLETGYHPAAARRLPAEVQERWLITAGRGRVTIVTEQDHALRLRTRTERGMRVTLTTPYFPGWQVWLDGRPAEVGLQDGTGYMQVRVPPGTHLIHARFTNSPIRAWANGISAASAGLLALLIAAPLASRRRRGPGDRNALAAAEPAGPPAREDDTATPGPPRDPVGIRRASNEVDANPTA